MEVIFMLQKFTLVLYYLVMEILPPVFMIMLVKGILTNDIIDMWTGAITVLLDVAGQILIKVTENEED